MQQTCITKSFVKLQECCMYQIRNILAILVRLLQINVINPLSQSSIIHPNSAWLRLWFCRHKLALSHSSLDWVKNKNQFVAKKCNIVTRMQCCCKCFATKQKKNCIYVTSQQYCTFFCPNVTAATF